MSVGTGTLIAMGVMGGIQAGTSIYGAKKQSDSAKTAAAQQQAAAREATAAQTPLYTQALAIAQQQAAQGQARLDPYASQGGAGLTALSSFLGVPQPSASANAASSAALSPYAALPQQAAIDAQRQQAQATANNGAVAATGARPMNIYGPSGYLGPGQPNGLPLQTPEQAAAQRALMAGGAGAPSGAPAGGGGMVLLRAPNGQTQSVPAAQAAFFLARGATQV